MKDQLDWTSTTLWRISVGARWIPERASLTLIYWIGHILYRQPSARADMLRTLITGGYAWGLYSMRCRRATKGHNCNLFPMGLALCRSSHIAACCNCAHQIASATAVAQTMYQILTAGSREDCHIVSTMFGHYSAAGAAVNVF